MAKLPEEMNVTISFSPETLSEAVEIIRSSINGDRDMRNAWIASVQNWLNDFDRCSISTLARDFVDWLAEGDVPTEHAQDRDSTADGQSVKPADMVSSLSDGCKYLEEQ